MIPRTEKLLITFYTTTDAMAMERLCRETGTDGRIIPVPGVISADCGLGWCADVGCEAGLRALMERHRIRHQGIHICMI